MISITPNYDEMGEFLSEIAEDRSEEWIQLYTLSDCNKKDGDYYTLNQKVTQIDDFSRKLLKPLINQTFAEGKGLFINTVSVNKGKNFINPLAIVADYDYEMEPLTKDPLIELDLPIPTVRV